MKKVYDELIHCRASEHPPHTFLRCARLAFMLGQNKDIPDRASAVQQTLPLLWGVRRSDVTIGKLSDYF